ncbi:MAG: DNA-processing protein DprA [bacterium]
MASGEEQAAVLALTAATDREWHRTASIIEQAGSALRVLRAEWNGLEPFDIEDAEAIARRVKPGDLDRYREMIEQLAEQGVRLLTVVDESYPRNLRRIYNLPPFLMIRGMLLPEDERAIAVVGTRSPSPEGREQARRLAKGLAERQVTVLSGLARGIDTEAHEGALTADGRTVAVMGTGIKTIYPPENEPLAQRIVDRGALVSQFWPDAHPTRTNFPLRNVVMSGMAIGTVVVEAGATSGAKMQARFALDHGKRLFLVDSLVLQEEWAKRYAEKPGATVVDSVDDIIQVLTSMAQPVEQLTLG